MISKPRVFVSVPDDRHLDDRRKGLKRAIIGFIAGQGFDLVGFEPERWGAGLSLNREVWTVEKADKLIRRCDGAVLLAWRAVMCTFWDPMTARPAMRSVLLQRFRRHTIIWKVRLRSRKS
jgi:hypothetical protein